MVICIVGIFRFGLKNLIDLVYISLLSISVDLPSCNIFNWHFFFCWRNCTYTFTLFFKTTV